MVNRSVGQHRTSEHFDSQSTLRVEECVNAPTHFNGSSNQIRNKLNKNRCFLFPRCACGTRRLHFAALYKRTESHDAHGTTKNSFLFSLVHYWDEIFKKEETPQLCVHEQHVKIICNQENTNDFHFDILLRVRRRHCCPTDERRQHVTSNESVKWNCNLHVKF